MQTSIQSPEIIAVAVAAVRHYAETHPRPPHVSAAQAADMLGVSPATITRMTRAGTLRLNRAGKIPISEIDAALIARDEKRRV